MNKHHQAFSSPIHHHRPNPSSDAPKKIKLLCSFGGSFIPRPAGGKLRYSGGETRIISINRSVGISQLRSRLAELSSSPTLSLKYQLPDSAIDAPLVSVSTDEDVTHMIEEHERIESEGKLTRLRLFLCDDSGENTMPWSCGFTGLPAVSCGNRSVVHFCPSEFHVKHNGFLANSECRTGNHRIRLCDIQNHRSNACNTGHHRIGGFDGRFCCKCYAGPRPRSNILKCGHVRSHIGRPCYDTHEYTMERRTMKVVEPSSKRTQPLFDIENSKGLPRNRALHQRNGRKLVDQDARIEREIETCLCGETNIRKDLFGYDQVPRGFLGHEKHSCPIKQQCHLPDIFFYNPIPCFGDMTVGDNVPYYSVQADHEILTQTMSKNPIISPRDPIGINVNFHDLNLQPSSKESAKRDCMDLGFNRIRPNFEGLQHKDVQRSKSDFANLEASSCSTKPSADLYVHKQSLLSQAEVVPPALHSSQKNDGCFSLELMDVTSSNLGTSVKKVTTLGSHDCDDKDSSQKVSGLLCPSATRVSSKPEKDLAGSVENRQTILNGSDMQEKDNAQGYGDGSKIDSIVSKNVKILQTCFSTSELQTIKNSDLEEIRTLGTGTYGTVSYGKWKGCDVAIKRIKPSCFPGDAMSEDRLVAGFWKEAHILSQLHHPNVVAFYGVVRDEQITNLATVTEYMANGSLKQVLQRKDRTIDRRKRLIIAMDAAFGMEYLHGKNIVHFDLKSHNFLVNMKDPQRPVCKIGDLGLSKAKQKTLVSGGVRGTLPWMAPELLNGKNGLVSEKIDVYSFGIVMWELLTGEEPHGNMRSSEIIGAVINDGIRPEIPHWCDPMWRSLMERCWSSDPDSRPPFSEIAKELRAMAASVNIK